MPVPKKRQSSSRQWKRRANWKLKSVNLSACPDCGSPTLPHHACPSCGRYQGRSVIEIKQKSEKAEKPKKTEKVENKEEAKAEKKPARKPAKKAAKKTSKPGEKKD